MFRPVAALLAAALQFATVFGAPLPKAAPPIPSYHPTTLGHRWEWERGTIIEITTVEQKDGAHIVTLTEIQPSRRRTKETVSISKTGIYTVAVSGIAVKPVCVLKFPVKADDTWEWEIEPTVETKPGDNVRRTKGTRKVGKEDEVEVPAGKFKAVPVEVIVLAENGKPLPEPERYVYWYARDLGVIKLTKNGSVIHALKSFEPAKK